MDARSRNRARQGGEGREEDGALYNTFKGDAIGFRCQRFIGFGIE